VRPRVNDVPLASWVDIRTTTVRARVPSWYLCAVTSRTWQMLAAVLSVGILIVVIVKYGLGDDDARKPNGQLHVGTEHHTAELPGTGGKPAHDGDKPSPIEVYANAKVGDWRAYTVKSEWSTQPPIRATAMTRIREVTDQQIVRSFSGRLDETEETRPDRDERRPRRGLTIDQLTGNDIGGWTIYDLVITDEDHTVGGRTFKCKKLTYASNDPLVPSKRTRTVLWISAEVPVDGVVEEREIQDMPGVTFIQTQTLIGFGTAGATTWGEKPEGL
jgi:hypothetical protein